MARLTTRRTTAPFVLLFMLVLAACGATNDAPAADPAASEAAPSSPLTGTFGTIDGGQIEFSSLEGQDVVLWFWAPW